MSLKKGWTLTEMVVAIGVMGVLLALAGELTLFLLKANGEIQRRQEINQRALSLMEQVIGEVLRAKRVQVGEDGLKVNLGEREIFVPKRFKEGKFWGEWTFEWEKGNLLRVRLELRDERGKGKVLETALFVPLRKRGGGEG